MAGEKTSPIHFQVWQMPSTEAGPKTLIKKQLGGERRRKALKRVRTPEKKATKNPEFCAKEGKY